MIDLHTHSTASDGSLTPRALAREGKRCGLKVQALTDHDGLGGLDDFLDEAEQISLIGLPGIELSAEVPRGQLHLVGLNINRNDVELQGFCERILCGREARNIEILEAFNDIGIDLTLEEVARFAGEDLISRVHFAQALVKRGLVASVKEAFTQYLEKGGKCYRDRYRATPEECIGHILRTEGIPIMAHPFSLDTNPETLLPKIAALKEAGLVGMECYYSTYDTEQTVEVLRIAHKLDLLPSVGSDFHGAPKPDIALGRLPIPETAQRRLMTLLGV